MKSKEILPEDMRRDLSKIPCIIQPSHGETVFVGLTHYLRCLEALESAELRIKMGAGAELDIPMPPRRVADSE